MTVFRLHMRTRMNACLSTRAHIHTAAHGIHATHSTTWHPRKHTCLHASTHTPHTHTIHIFVSKLKIERERERERESATDALTLKQRERERERERERAMDARP